MSSSKGHRAPKLELMGFLNKKDPFELLYYIEKQCKDYSGATKDYREKRCKQIAISCMKQYDYDLSLLQTNWLHVNIGSIVSSNVETRNVLQIGNLYTMAILCGDIVKPWEWIDSKEYTGKNGFYEESNDDIVDDVGDLVRKGPFYQYKFEIWHQGVVETKKITIPKI